MTTTPTSRLRAATRLRTEHDAPILRLAVPALGTLLAEPVYVLADTAIVARLGRDQVAGLGLASAVLLTWHGLMIFLSYGSAPATMKRRVGSLVRRWGWRSCSASVLRPWSSPSRTS